MAGSGIDRHTRNALKIMNGDLHVFIEDSTGVLKENIVPKGTSKLFGTDANGNFTLTDPPLAPKAGSLSLALADAGTKKISFAKAWPTGTTYVVEIHFNGLALGWTITSQTVTDFTFTYLATFAGTVYWTATPVTG